MLELNDVEAWRDYARVERRHARRVGLVPTMGALHEGHAALFRAARSECDVVIATLFVNPRQFNDASDLASYPRSHEADVTLAGAAGVDCLVAPTLEQMWPDYPAKTLTSVSMGALGEVFEGAGRPGHFDGVASVVAKLFVINGTCRAYFGEKDFQQLAVIRQLVRDLAFDVDVVACPIVRDADGLALSSRNVRLSDAGRNQALGFYRAIRHAGERARTASEQRATLRRALDDAHVQIAYAEVVDPDTLVPSLDEESGTRRALVAGFVEGVRLLDNGPVELQGGS